MKKSRAGPEAVVDTNLFVSGMIIERGNPFRLLRAWRREEFASLLSDWQRAELIRVFSRPKIVAKYQITPQRIAALFAGFDASKRVVPTPVVPIALRDPKDVPILAVALGGEADYLVTGDDDLLVVQDDPRLGALTIISVTDFLLRLVV